MSNSENAGAIDVQHRHVGAKFQGRFSFVKSLSLPLHASFTNANTFIHLSQTCFLCVSYCLCANSYHNCSNFSSCGLHAGHRGVMMLPAMYGVNAFRSQVFCSCMCVKCQIAPLLCRFFSFYRPLATVSASQLSGFRARSTVRLPSAS